MGQRTCSVEGCESPHRGHGLCNKHYQRWRVHGTTDSQRRSPEQRFWAKVDRRDSTECWLWQGEVAPNGYGKFYVRPISLAHRYAYQLLVGPIPAGLQLDHLCRVRHCVNPAHLEPVTSGENIRRGAWCGKTHCPKGHPYDEANTYLHGPEKRYRYCRACHRECERARRAARSAMRGMPDLIRAKARRETAAESER